VTASLIGAPGIAFGAVFGLFIAAFLVLVVVTMRWAVRRDRQGRSAWLERQRGAGATETPGPATTGTTNGSAPRRGRRRVGGPVPTTGPGGAPGAAPRKEPEGGPRP